MKARMNFPLFLFPLLLAAQVVSASTAVQGSLHLDGVLILRGDQEATARVIIIPLDAEQTTLNIGRHFTLELALDHSYLLSFEQVGMVTKQVYFDTRVPMAEQSRMFDFPFQVTLFEKGWNGIDDYTGPVGFVFYADERSDFVHRTDYNVKPGSKEERDIEELVARRTAGQGKAWAWSAIVPIEVHWVKHGKRGALFIGRSVAADGHLEAEGRFLDAKLQIRNGPFVFYHANGQVESRGEFVQGRKTGVWQRFDMQGMPLAERVYDPGALESIYQSMAATLDVDPPAVGGDFVMHGAAQRKAKVAGEPARVMHADIPGSTTKSADHDAGSMNARAVVRANRAKEGNGTGEVKRTADLTGGKAVNNSVHVKGATGRDDQAVQSGWEGQAEELIVERLRVTKVVHITEQTGHVTEYRRVTDRNGSVVYFQDGLNIPDHIYNTRTGR